MNSSTASIRNVHEMSTLRAFSLLTLCALGSAAEAERLAAHAPGAGQLDPLTKVVAYGDLNLETEAGAKVLYSRLRNAAKDVCAPLESRGMRPRRIWQNCFDNAVTTAVVQVNKTRVTALHNQTTGPGKGKPVAPASASNNYL